MRVLFLAHDFTSEDVGSGAHLPALAAALTRQGATVRVVTAGREPGVVTREDGVVVRTVAEPSSSSWRAPALWRALRAAAVQEVRNGCDVVHAHWWLPGGLVAPRGIPAVLTVHGPDVRLLLRSRTARLLAKAAFRRSRVVTTVSPHLAALLQKLFSIHIPGDRVRAMPVLSGRLPWTRGGDGALVRGRLVPELRAHLAIEATACLVSLDRPIALTICGDGPERPRLQRLAQELGLSALTRFAGPLPPAAELKLLERTDVVIDPAIDIGFARFDAEAMMAGIPAVACWDGGGAVDVVPERGAGRLTLPVPEAIADAVLELLSTPTTHDEVRALALRYRDDLSADSVAASCLRWYQEALA